jgi:hypothetical protein
MGICGANWDDGLSIGDEREGIRLGASKDGLKMGEYSFSATGIVDTGVMGGRSSIGNGTAVVESTIEIATGSVAVQDNGTFI